jgi:lipooligosaccharide transport system ATP-binding protein
VDALVARGLRKDYGGREVVAGLDFAVRRGECFGLLGPNGAGKTTTLRLCLGLVPASAGGVTLLGYDMPRQARQARMRAGVVAQFDALDPDFSVRENLLVYARYFGMNKKAMAGRLPALLEFADLTNRAESRINSLSGGMKRRLALARAMVNEPDILLLDEPTTGLDPAARHLMWQRLRGLITQGRTVLLTTHFMEEAERLCDRLAIMDNGRIIAAGTPRELIDAHIEPHVVEIFGETAHIWCDQNAAPLAARVERSGESVFCYLREAGALLGQLERAPQLRYLHRPANLEDVFLKLTGHEIRDG